MSFLSATGLVAGYGGAPIINECSLAVDKEQIAVIVGPNGAGKSTAMKAILGMVSVEKGSVMLGDKDVTNLNPRQCVEAGMGFVPQTNNIFTTLSVQENLEIGGFLRKDDTNDTLDHVYHLSPILYDKRNQAAGELSGGQRQQLAVARALMTKPDLLLLDEPTAGVSPIVMDELFDRIIDIRNSGVAVLMVEQNAQKALEIADIGYVLVNGKNRFTGSGQDLINDAEVRKSFLGG